MKFRLVLGGLLMLAPLAGAHAMPVSTFLDKATALQRKGPLAMFSGDLKLLMNQVKADAQQLRSERLAAEAAKRPAAFCPPAKGASLSDKDILKAMQAVPAAQRPRTSTKDALRVHMAGRYPCKR
jgi:hypothetical protein